MSEPSELLTSVLTCMDHRLDPLPILGLEPREAHVVRNAGGYLTDDAIRSLCLSQQLAGTRRVVVLHHTDCRASEKTAEDYRAMVETGTGVSPNWDVVPVGNPLQRARIAMEQLKASPLVDTTRLEGYIYDVNDGSLTPVE
ncbi:beta-class carbonic anhydrase [Candidatus Poriferisocius sp.]|uniref:beta-class carbonic anhydrase n=1 Tax=Candidatus Poriferisocius sp. TaxID=3101276 RepID=UPI003B01F24A